MRLRSLYRFVMLVMSGAVVFQTTTSCSDEAISTFTTTLSEALTTLVSSGITDYVNQYMTTTT